MPAQEASGPVSVYICKDSPTRKSSQTLIRGIAAALATEKGAKGRIMGEADCGAQVPETACTAGIYDRGGRVLICSARTLTQIMRISAWYSLTHAARPNENYDDFRSRLPPRIELSLFRSNLAAGSDPGLDEAALEQLRTAAEQDPAATSDARIFVAILDLVLAGIIGHEASHLTISKPFCDHDGPGRLEKEGVFDVIRRVQGSNELFAPAFPVKEEVAADRCAARALNRAAARLDGDSWRADRHFVRRVAADILAMLLLVRPQGQTGPEWVVNDAYLRPPLRMFLLVGELGASGVGPRICGGAAEAVVQGVQSSFQMSPGDGKLPDALEHLLPPRVAAAWNGTEAWSPAVFRCE